MGKCTAVKNWFEIRFFHVFGKLLCIIPFILCSCMEIVQYMNYFSYITGYLYNKQTSNVLNILIWLKINPDPISEIKLNCVKFHALIFYWWKRWQRILLLYAHVVFKFVNLSPMLIYIYDCRTYKLHGIFTVSYEKLLNISWILKIQLMPRVLLFNWYFMVFSVKFPKVQTSFYNYWIIYKKSL